MINIHNFADHNTWCINLGCCWQSDVDDSHDNNDVVKTDNDDG